MGKSFGLWLANLRKKRGYSSQRQLAIASGVSNSTISRIESGEQEPGPETLKKIAPYLGVSYQDLMTATGYLDPADIIKTPEQQVESAVSGDSELLEFWLELKKREDLRLLFRQVKPMTPKGIKKIMRVIKAMEDEGVIED
jgi:transcriptional regulator with XRE-family HTH domain